jgi:hypothetical protein
MMEPAYIWTEEDFLRNEAETENCIDLLGHLLHDHALVSWVKNNEAARYSADIAAGIQAVLISDFEENLRRGEAALRQLAALAEEAREAAANASNKERA